MAAHRLDARIERRVAAEAGIERQRAGDERGREGAFRGEQAGKGECRRHLRAIEEREALFGAKRDRAQAGARQRIARRHDPALDPRLAFADQDRGKMRERREIAGCPNRALRRDARNDARVRERNEGLDHAPANARVAARERRRLERDDEAHDGIVEQGSGPRGMRQHERALQLREAGVVDARPGEKAEAGVDAVDGPPGSDHAVDGLRRGVDRRFRRGVDRKRHRLRPQPAQVGEFEAGGHEVEGLHGCITGMERHCAAAAPPAPFTAQRSPPL